MNLGTAQVVRGDARHLPLADNSVDLVVTSPPYFALRSYQDGGEHYAGQIGDEPTPAEFIAALLEVTAECVRVLKPSGSLWVNLGDKYSGAQQQSSGRESTVSSADYWRRTNPKTTVVRAKSLYGIPWRYALACIDDLGLILRAEVIWSKPNGLPESVTDRVRRSHEQWFHFTLQPRYFSAVDEIREPHVRSERPWERDGRHPDRSHAARDAGLNHLGDGKPVSFNPLGKLPGSVWTIPTEPLRVPDHLGIDHFAAFPTEWPKRIIQGWSPVGVCVDCGEGLRPVVDRGALDPDAVAAISGRRSAYRETGADGQTRGAGATSTTRTGLSGQEWGRLRTPDTITGYACACPGPTADTTPAVVLDPFGGTGTTALVAKALGRHGITVDMSNDYCRLAEWRTNDRDQLAKVLGLDKAPPVHDDEQSLLDLIEGGAA